MKEYTELIDRLRADCSYYVTRPGDRSTRVDIYDINEAINAIIDLRSRLAAQEENKWISVLERLPERGELVLTYSHNVNIKFRENYRWIVFGKSRSGREEWLYQDEYVTHWRPLPPAPQEEQL